MDAVSNEETINKMEKDIKDLSGLITKIDILTKELIERRVKSAQLACTFASLLTPEVQDSSQALGDMIEQTLRDQSSGMEDVERSKSQLKDRLAQLTADSVSN